MPPTLLLASLWALFLGSHLLLSHPPVRGPLANRLGEGAFYIAYSLVSFVFFVPTVAVWWGHRHEGTLLWSLRQYPAAVHGAELLALVGFVLVFGGLVRPAPSAAAATMLKLPPEVRGMAHFTRHPLFMGLSLWAVAHLLVNGWATDVAFFAGFPLTTVIGAAHQDWRKARSSPGYAAVVARTTFFPWPRLANPGRRVLIGGTVGAVVAVAIRALHPVLFGG